MCKGFVLLWVMQWLLLLSIITETLLENDDLATRLVNHYVQRLSETTR